MLPYRSPSPRKDMAKRQELEAGTWEAGTEAEVMEE